MLLSLLLVTVTIQADAVCKRDILISYGLQGLNKPSGKGIEMCPGITNSCCQSSDQLDIYANWVHSKEVNYVKKHYSKVTEIYNRALEAMVSVRELAANVEKKLATRKISNCKVIAQRIQVFDITAIEEKIKENIRKMEEFFISSYQGFYCAICNYDNHEFFDVRGGTIIYSEKFCRDIVEHTLPSLLFFKTNVVKYFNLLSKFLVSCDHKGDYETDTPIPIKFLFLADEKVDLDLKECKNARNEKNWFIYCRNICENFNLVSFSGYYEPILQKLKHYTKFLNTQVAKIKHGGIGRNLMKTLIKTVKKKKSKKVKKKMKKERILVTDADHTAHMRDKSRDGIIFKAGLESKVQLIHFKSKFEVKGLSLFDDGRNSLISSAMYNSIKANIHVKNLKTSDVSETVSGSGVATVLSAGNSGASLIQVVVLTLLLMFN